MATRRSREKKNIFLLKRCRSRRRSRAHVLMSQRPAAAERLRTSCAGSARFRSAKEPAGGTQRERGLVFLGRRRPAAFAQAEARCPGNYARRLCSEKDVRSALDCANTSSDTTLWVLEIPRRHPGPARHPEQAGLSTRPSSLVELSLSLSVTHS